METRYIPLEDHIVTDNRNDSASPRRWVRSFLRLGCTGQSRSAGSVAGKLKVFFLLTMFAAVVLVCLAAGLVGHPELGRSIRNWRPRPIDGIGGGGGGVTSSGGTSAYKVLPSVKELGPPRYERIKQMERELPQHDPELDFPEGRHGRYLRFANAVQQLGWNNVFNELLMNTHLAYKSKRAFVFTDYIWKAEYYHWPPAQWRDSPPHTPLNALISGPSAGGPWDPADPSHPPRSVHESYYNQVCPASARRIIHTRDVKPAIAWRSGHEIFAHWQKLLLDARERCVEIWPAERSEDNFPQVFDLYLWGSDRILSLWDEFRESPVSRLLSASPLVRSAVARNEYLFMPGGGTRWKQRGGGGGGKYERGDAHGWEDDILAVSTSPWDRMLAMHVRRGDYQGACHDLAKWNSTFYSWNLLPELPDKFIPPPGGGWGWNTKENEEKYLEHCLPTFEAIVRKVRGSKEDYMRDGTVAIPTAAAFNASARARTKKEWRVLDVLYLLTNEESEWLDELKMALRKDGWRTIKTSRDLELDQEQTDVGMAVDMEIARKAAVFIGNGWSSFTSNIVHGRVVDGRDPISIRFY